MASHQHATHLWVTSFHCATSQTSQAVYKSSAGSKHLPIFHDEYTCTLNTSRYVTDGFQWKNKKCYLVSNKWYTTNEAKQHASVLAPEGFFGKPQHVIICDNNADNFQTLTNAQPSLPYVDKKVNKGADVPPTSLTPYLKPLFPLYYIGGIGPQTQTTCRRQFEVDKM